MNKTQGRCWTCKKVFHWKGKPILRNAFCPYCGSKLYATTHIVFKRLPIGRAKPITHEKEKIPINKCECDFCRICTVCNHPIRFHKKMQYHNSDGTAISKVHPVCQVETKQIMGFSISCSCDMERRPNI